MARDEQAYRLHSGILSVQQAVCFSERNLTQEEECTLRLLQATHRTGGETALINVDMHASMLGGGDVSVAVAMKKVHPCDGFLHSQSGIRISREAEGAEACGKSRWCLNCRSVHAALLDLPHLSQLSDQVTAWLCVCLQAWANKASAQFVDAKICPEHQCDLRCSMYNH